MSRLQSNFGRFLLVLLGFEVGLLAQESVAVAQFPNDRTSTDLSRAPVGGSPTYLPQPQTASELLLGQLAANPITGPYRFQTQVRGGRVVLRGVVGSTKVHGVAVQIATDSGIPFVDELVIDTAAGEAVALQASAAFGPPPIAPLFPTYGASSLPFFGPRAYPPPTYTFYGSYPGGPPSYLYPRPLFGRIDEPFFGFEPPVISYPPYWGTLSARRLAEASASGALPMNNIEPEPEVPPGSLDLEIDPRGVGLLRGTVPSEKARIAAAERVAQLPGVSRVINRLEVDPSMPLNPSQPNEFSPSGPGSTNPAPPAPGPAEQDPFDGEPELAGLPIRASIRDGVATIEGEVPSAFEAMWAYLAAKRTPGVDVVIDRLRFTVPVGQGKNPLLTQGDRRDVEEYLDDQIRRAVGDRGRVDRVALLGDRLEIELRIEEPALEDQINAILRTTPVLRGFDLAPSFEILGP